MADGIIITIIAVSMAAVLWKKIRDFRAGKSGCGCGCSGRCGGCPSKPSE